MQLALQYLCYSQNILTQKIQITKLYIAEQAKQLENCKELRKKQRQKLKKYEHAIDKLNEQALQYELMAKRVCPWILENKNNVIKTLMEGDEKILKSAQEGDTFYQRLEDLQQQKMDAADALKNPSTKKKTERLRISEEIPANVNETPREEVKTVQMPAKQQLTIEKAEEVNIDLPEKKVVVEEEKKIVKKESEKPPSNRKDLESINSESDASLQLSLSQTGSQLAFPSSSGRATGNMLSINANPENIISKGVILPEQNLFKHPSNTDEKEDKDVIKEDIQDEDD